MLHCGKQLIYSFSGSVVQCWKFCLGRIGSLQNWLESVILTILEQGPVPRHVGVIMDGNRRYADKMGYTANKSRGHIFGLETLEKVLKWGSRLDIKCVTVYAFSIENYKRSPKEVDFLMHLALEKVAHILVHDEWIHRHQVRINVVGDLSLLRNDVRQAALAIMQKTRTYSKRVLNIAAPYTSTEEIATCIRTKSQVACSQEPLISMSLASNLYTPSSCDLLLRTSGICRLSNFLSWQATHHCQLEFFNIFWPEFSLWHFVLVILSYQASQWQIH